MSKIKVFDDPSTFTSEEGKSVSLSNAQRCNCDLRRNVAEMSAPGASLKSLETQEAKPGFMFDGRELIGGKLVVGGDVI